jgi:hypothetical protein
MSVPGIDEAGMNEAGMNERRLTESERDDAYTRICLAITEAGPERESLFLARLSLLLAEAVGDAQRVREAIAAARLV